MENISWKEFYNLPVFEFDERITLESGNYFLMGNSVEDQIYIKKPGDVVTVYQVVKNDNEGCSFIEKRIQTYQPDKKGK